MSGMVNRVDKKEDTVAASEILQMAIEIEKQGILFYDGIIRKARNSKMREIFNYMAEEEREHEKTFNAMLAETNGRAESRSQDEAKTVRYFDALIDRKFLPSEEDEAALQAILRSPSSAINHALTFEKDTLLFFHEMILITRKDHRSTVQKIIDEERNHVLKILKLKAVMRL